MAAIALAESSGNPDAKNKVSTATGLWQIMWSVWKNDPDMKAIGVTDRNSLTDPGRNAKAMAIVLRKQGYDAWEVYNTGAYKKFIPGADFSIPEGSLAGQAIDRFSPVAWLNPVMEWTKQALGQVGIGLLAGVFIILGVVILLRNTAAKAAVNVVAGGAGKAVKAVAK